MAPLEFVIHGTPSGPTEMATPGPSTASHPVPLRVCRAG